MKQDALIHQSPIPDSLQAPISITALFVTKPTLFVMDKMAPSRCYKEIRATRKLKPLCYTCPLQSLLKLPAKGEVLQAAEAASCLSICICSFLSQRYRYGFSLPCGFCGHITKVCPMGCEQKGCYYSPGETRGEPFSSFAMAEKDSCNHDAPRDGRQAWRIDH